MLCVVKKPRAQWNPALEKALVDLLHEHNNPYHRGQNGWSAESWNGITKIFHEKYPHTNFTKQQIQEKQKDLKSQYRIIKDARKQSGVSWNYHTHMIEADPHLWQNLIIVSLIIYNATCFLLFSGDLGLINHFTYIQSCPDISKFQTKPFPLYDKLGDLYDGEFNGFSFATFFLPL